MSTPTSGDVHVNAPLTNISIAYIQDQSAFIADKVFPNVPVAKQSDRYYVYKREDFNRDGYKVRAPSTESQGGGYDLDNTPTYYANVWALHKDIDDQIRANSDAVLNPDRDATQWLTTQALIRRENAWASKYFTTGLWGTDLTGAASSPSTGQFLQWDNAASTPIETIRAAKRTVAGNTGFRPNTLTLGRAVFDALLDHPDIVDRVKYSFQGQAGNPALTNTQVLAQLFEVDRVLVSDAVVNTAQKGQTEASSFILGKNALLSYAAPTPSLLVPSAGYTFSWTGFFGAGNMGVRIKKFRMEWLESDRIEGEMAFDQKLVGADLGYFFSGAVA